MSDEEETHINTVVGVESGKVVVLYSEPTDCISYPPEDAIKLAETLVAKAKFIQESEPG